MSRVFEVFISGSFQTSRRISSRETTCPACASSTRSSSNSLLASPTSTPSTMHPARGRLHPHPARVEHLRRAAAQQRPHPGQQLGQPERLAHVVVRARVEPDDEVDLVGARGQHEHRAGPACRRGRGGTPRARPCPAGPRSSTMRSTSPSPARVDRRRTVVDDVDLVALALQRAGQRSGDRRIVLDEQHGGHGATVDRRCDRASAARSRRPVAPPPTDRRRDRLSPHDLELALAHRRRRRRGDPRPLPGGRPARRPQARPHPGHRRRHRLRGRGPPRCSPRTTARTTPCSARSAAATAPVDRARAGSSTRSTARRTSPAASRCSRRCSALVVDGRADRRRRERPRPGPAVVGGARLGRVHLRRGARDRRGPIGVSAIADLADAYVSTTDLDYWREIGAQDRWLALTAATLGEPRRSATSSTTCSSRRA